jgi:uncharacterized protein YxjI
MPVQFACSCGKQLRVRDELTGKKVKCPGCGAVLTVEGTAPPPVASAEEEQPRPHEVVDAQVEAAGAEEVAPRGEREDNTLMRSNTFVVKEQAKLFASRKAYDLLDGETGEALGSVRQKSGGLLGLLMSKDTAPVTLEVCDTEGEVVFAVRRRGLFFRKVEAVNAQGQVLGTYKEKTFSLTGGFHVYDDKGKHLAQIKGKWFKDEYRFLTPGGVEMGLVSRKWGGMMRELFSSASTYAVQVSPECARDRRAKMLILGAALALDTLFPKKGGGAAAGGSSEGGAAKASEDE